MYRLGAGSLMVKMSDLDNITTEEDFEKSYPHLYNSLCREENLVRKDPVQAEDEKDGVEGEDEKDGVEGEDDKDGVEGEENHGVQDDAGNPPKTKPRRAGWLEDQLAHRLKHEDEDTQRVYKGIKVCLILSYLILCHLILS